MILDLYMAREKRRLIWVVGKNFQKIFGKNLYKSKVFYIIGASEIQTK